jgi:hypothetical protein
MTTTINTTLDDVFKSTPMGTVDTAIGLTFFGLNHRQQANPVPINKDNYGLTFFTRPQLNLTTGNTRALRNLIPLLTNDPASIQRIIRCYLDPRLGESNINSPFVDNTNAFMPLLTNHLLSCSGWPDPLLETHTSKPGIYKEVFSYTDSNIDNYSAYDVTATFRNMQGDPITSLIHTWLKYQSAVFEGIMVPYSDFLVKHEIDYNTRIYRLVLDKNRNTVQKIACSGAAFPTSVPLGNAFNFEHDKPLNASNDQVSVTFRCIGACYNDDILIHEFNTVVEIFNTSMEEGKRASSMKLLDASELGIFNNAGYPRINPDSYRLEWYVRNEEYARVTSAYNRHYEALNTKTPKYKY